jgi:hypothetical protein
MVILDWRFVVYTLVVCAITGAAVARISDVVLGWVGGVMVGMITLATILAVTALFCNC